MEKFLTASDESIDFFFWPVLQPGRHFSRSFQSNRARMGSCPLHCCSVDGRNVPPHISSNRIRRSIEIQRLVQRPESAINMGPQSPTSALRPIRVRISLCPIRHPEHGIRAARRRRLPPRATDAVRGPNPHPPIQRRVSRCGDAVHQRHCRGVRSGGRLLLTGPQALARGLDGHAHPQPAGCGGGGAVEPRRAVSKGAVVWRHGWLARGGGCRPAVRVAAGVLLAGQSSEDDHDGCHTGCQGHDYEGRVDQSLGSAHRDGMCRSR